MEKSFSKFCDYSDAFNLTVDDFFAHTLKSIKWPCSQHKCDTLASILSYYVTMRMRQYTQVVNKNVAKVNAKKKKCSKLTVS